MKTTADIRREIDAIDDEIAGLYLRRLDAVREIAAAKQAAGAPVADPAREQEILDRISARVGPELSDGAARLFKTLFSISRARQRRLAAQGAAPRPRSDGAAAKIAIAGMGLIGGSLYKAARRAGYDVRGFDQGDLVAVSDADLVFVALAPAAALDWIRLHEGSFKAGAVVVDTCGVKGAICRALADGAPARRWTFVGGHPMAGKEVSGFANSDADLFRRASMILTPAPGTPPATLEALRRVFADLGFARVVVADPGSHDEIIAFTSQLCHLVSSAYVREGLALRHDGFSAGSFRDMVRVGAPDPALWAELLDENRDAILPVLDRFLGRLRAFRDALAAKDRPAVAAQLAEGGKAKAALAALAAQPRGRGAKGEP